MKKDFLTLNDCTADDINYMLKLALDIKASPSKYSTTMSRKTLLMIFDKPSLRTRVSFEAGITQMNGHAIYYNVSTSPLGRKETMADTAKTSSRYVDLIMARIGNHQDIQELAQNSDVPVINAMTNLAHPCQVLSDILTIYEKKGRLKGLKLAYLGCGNNNVTHSLLHGCAIAGMDISVGSPESDFPMAEVVETAKKNSSGKVEVTSNAQKAVSSADVVYTDSWMSYHIPPEQMEARKQLYTPYQVNSELMKHAKPDAIFMNCLPAMRGMEQTAEVIDGPQSIVFDQAENRLHAQKALMLKLLGL